MQELFGEDIHIVDYYNQTVKTIIEEAFRISNQNPWYNVEIYRDISSCVSFTGYYDDKK